MSDDDRFIQKAIKKPGSLRRIVSRRFGKKGFTEQGNIKQEVVSELAKEPGKVGKKARLAKTLRRIRVGRDTAVY